MLPACPGYLFLIFVRVHLLGLLWSFIIFYSDIRQSFSSSDDDCESKNVDVEVLISDLLCRYYGRPFLLFLREPPVFNSTGSIKMKAMAANSSIVAASMISDLL